MRTVSDIPAPMTADAERDAVKDWGTYYAACHVCSDDVLTLRFDAQKLSALALDALPAWIRRAVAAESHNAELVATLEKIMADYERIGVWPFSDMVRAALAQHNAAAAVGSG